MTSSVAMALATTPERGQARAALTPVVRCLFAVHGRHLAQAEFVGALQKSGLSHNDRRQIISSIWRFLLYCFAHYCTQHIVRIRGIMTMRSAYINGPFIYVRTYLLTYLLITKAGRTTICHHNKFILFCIIDLVFTYYTTTWKLMYKIL